MTPQEEIQKAIADKELYAIGDTDPVDWHKAYEAYSRLAKQGNVKAQYNLGYMYARGDVTTRDFALAYDWYQKAAAKNDPRAHYNISLMYEKGEHVLTNSLLAKEHMDKAIELGDERAKIKTALSEGKEALKRGDREKAKSLFGSIADSNKEAEMGVIASNIAFKSTYKTRIKYSSRSKKIGQTKHYWKWGEAVVTELDLSITNTSSRSWHVMVKALTRGSDGFVHISEIGGVLRAGESQSNIIKPADYASSKICGVAVYSDRDGSINKPVYSFHFPDIPILPGEEDTKKLLQDIQKAKNAMMLHNKTAQPGPCFVLTACYGSHDAPTVLAFRRFRDRHLTRYTPGRYFIAWYYRHGPGYARAIDDKPALKAIFRSLFSLLAKILPR